MVENESIRQKLLEGETETALGEPQWWLYLSSGRSIEVCLESDGLEPKDYYFSLRLHCSEEEFDKDLYNKTCGIIEVRTTEYVNGAIAYGELPDDVIVAVALLIDNFHENLEDS